MQTKIQPAKVMTPGKSESRFMKRKPIALADRHTRKSETIHFFPWKCFFFFFVKGDSRYPGQQSSRRSKAFELSQTGDSRHEYALIISPVVPGGIVRFAYSNGFLGPFALLTMSIQPFVLSYIMHFPHVKEEITYVCIYSFSFDLFKV